MKKNDKLLIVLSILFYLILEPVKYLFIFKGKLKVIAIILSILGAITSILLLSLILRKDFNTKKMYNLLDISSTILLFVNVISGFLVECTIYKYDKEKFEEINLKKIDKLEYPKLKPIKSKYSFLYFVVLMGLLSLYYIDLPFLDNIPYDYVDLLFEGFLLIVSIVVYFKYLKRDINAFFKNIKVYIVKGYKTFIIGFLISTVVLFVLQNIIGQANNQTVLEEIFKQENVFIYFITTVIFAPIAEEIMNRGMIKRFISNDILYIIISGLIFGLLHVTGFNQPWYDYLWIIYYGSVGSTLAYLYAKSDNICLPIFFHMFVNFFSTIGVIIRYM